MIANRLWLEGEIRIQSNKGDTLRREQSKKSDVDALVKENDEIICQVMVEGRPVNSRLYFTCQMMWTLDSVLEIIQR